MDDAVLWTRMWDGLACLQRLMGRHAPGGRVLERDGYVASVIGAVPYASLPNAAVALEPTAVLADLDELGRAYSDAGVLKWGVWIDGADEEATRALAAKGLVLDSNPAPMVAPLHEIDLGGLDGTDQPRIADGPTVGRVNDVAYGMAERRPIETMLGGLPAEVARGTRFDLDGEPVSVMMAGDHGEDTAVWFVATVPNARHQGLATRLMKRALAEARQRGQTSTTLQASAKGEPVYSALGYRRLGTLHLWEKRS
jgi:GNAT superfamily N-acetyltransferase